MRSAGEVRFSRLGTVRHDIRAGGSVCLLVCAVGKAGQPERGEFLASGDEGAARFAGPRLVRHGNTHGLPSARGTATAIIDDGDALCRAEARPWAAIRLDPVGLREALVVGDAAHLRLLSVCKCTTSLWTSVDGLF